MLWLFKINFRGFRRFLIHGNSSYVVLYTQCLRYNICSAWFLDIGIFFKVELFLALLANSMHNYTAILLTTEYKHLLGHSSYLLAASYGSMHLFIEVLQEINLHKHANFPRI